ncbi:hypothetical protein RDI58_010678 [Solanum bulbocastanum]|uniref:Uncharacterized protein n=1 Tax=Solanum bulbocastanum TaxID=147425 RepID=A0AAN8TUB1_SOLBU
MAPSLPERRWKEDQLNTERGGNKSIHEVPCYSYLANRSQIGAIGGKSIKKKVTIHMRNNINSLQEQNVKLIILLDTLEELFILVTTRRTILQRFSEKQSRSGIWGLEENHLNLLLQNRYASSLFPRILEIKVSSCFYKEYKIC